MPPGAGVKQLQICYLQTYQGWMEGGGRGGGVGEGHAVFDVEESEISLTHHS